MCTHLKEKHFEKSKSRKIKEQQVYKEEDTYCTYGYNVKEQPESTSSAEEQTSPSKAFYFEETFPVIEKLINKYFPILQEVSKKVVAHEEHLNRNKDSSLSSSKNSFPLAEIAGFTRGRIDEMKRNKQFKIKPRNLLGLKSQNDWIFNVNIGNVMQLSGLRLQDLVISSQLAHEISRDALYEKLIMTAIAYFSLATEYRLLNTFNRLYENESKYWHKAAIELVCTFIPNECPLVTHIISNYEKYNSLSQEVIVHSKKIFRPKTLLRRKKILLIVR